MAVLKYIFSFHGRFARIDFWLLTIILLLAIAIAWAVQVLQIPGSFLVALIAVLAGFVGWFSGVVRRLHDRDKSAWYLLLFFGLPSALQGFFKGGSGLYLFSGGIGSGAIDLICLAISIWTFAELGFLTGTAGENKYGPSPGATPPAGGESPSPLATQSGTD